MKEFIEALSKDPNTTNALATVASVFVAMFAFVISIISLVVALRSLSTQRRHNYLSVRPLAFISRADYENRISVELHNNGVGPLIIQKLLVSDGKSAKESLIDWMPALPHSLTWDTFVRDLRARSLAPEHKIVLIQISGDPNDPDFCDARDVCRAALKTLTLELHYSDVYDRALEPAHQTLSWFGRHDSHRPNA